MDARIIPTPLYNKLRRIAKLSAFSLLEGNCYIHLAMKVEQHLVTPSSKTLEELAEQLARCMEQFPVLVDTRHELQELLMYTGDLQKDATAEDSSLNKPIPVTYTNNVIPFKKK
jgi:hypothetical protein